MRRADRLFRIVLELRNDKPITAHKLADRLEVSERTIYRDIQDLTLSGIPIVAEPGSGYRLMDGYRLPPLMFDQAELEALLLGIQMVGVWSDSELAQAAERAAAKIDAVLPERLRPELDRNDLLVPPFGPDEEVANYLHQLRGTIRNQIKVHFHYQRADGQLSDRIVRPLGLAYWGRTWTLISWCELRNGFRNFRLDRMNRLVENGQPFEQETGKTLKDYLATVEQETKQCSIYNGDQR